MGRGEGWTRPWIQWPSWRSPSGGWREGKGGHVHGYSGRAGGVLQVGGERGRVGTSMDTVAELKESFRWVGRGEGWTRPWIQWLSWRSPSGMWGKGKGEHVHGYSGQAGGVLQVGGERGRVDTSMDIVAKVEESFRWVGRSERWTCRWIQWLSWRRPSGMCGEGKGEHVHGYSGRAGGVLQVGDERGRVGTSMDTVAKVEESFRWVGRGEGWTRPWIQWPRWRSPSGGWGEGKGGHVHGNNGRSNGIGWVIVFFTTSPPNLMGR